MNDDTHNIVPGKVAIVDTKGVPMNKGAEGHEPVRRTHAHRRDFAQLRDLDELRRDMAELTRRINDAIPTAALEVGEKMYAWMTDETGKYLEEMEAAIFDRVMRELEARSFRGRVKRFWRRFFPPPALEILRDANDVMVGINRTRTQEERADANLQEFMDS